MQEEKILTPTQKYALAENEKFWNKAMDYLLVCPFSKEHATIEYLFSLNQERDRILEGKSE